MEYFLVEGGARPRGEVEVSGAKNAALKLAAAALLASGQTVLHNVPRIKDVDTMLAVLEGLGPLVARFGEAEVSAPGGCNLGLRKFNFHLDGLRALGAEVELDHGFIKATASGGLKGAEVNFEYPSVTATENVMMAAVLADGVTIIENGAREPEVVALAEFLNSVGARVRGVGTGRIVIEGVDELTPVEWTVIPDRIEAGTFIMATAATGGGRVVEKKHPPH